MNKPDIAHDLTLLEKANLGHVLGLILAASWIFGGNIWWMRDVLAGWASLGLIITVAAFLQPGDRGHEVRSRAWWLLPWLLFIGLVLMSALNPSFRLMTVENSSVLVHLGEQWPRLPSAVDPGKTLHELWFYASVYLAAFNLLLVPRSRRPLRIILITGSINCLILAVFGTLQKLMADDIYFGAAHSPNIRFFATFIYYNHWGAFMVLWLATAAGLIFHYAVRNHTRDLWHSPFTAAALGLLLIAASAPVSASRAATGMAGVIILTVATHGLIQIIRQSRLAGRSAAPPVAALLIVIFMATFAIGWLAKRSISERYWETREALNREQSYFSGRAELYRDTWTLAMRKPVFGWGFESYGTAFLLIRPRPLATNRQFDTSYTEAHSDWLQSVAETGFVGTALVVLMGAIPFVMLARRPWRHPLVFYPLFGCTLVALYAWIEFPFANGAVVIAFWILFFVALRYASLQRQVDIPPTEPCIRS